MNLPPRKLILIPILHTAAELGTLAPRPRTVAQRVEFDRKQNLINAAWREIETNLLTWKQDFTGIFVYQDGLPVCENYAEIVRQVAAADSPNFILLLKLQELGAQIVAAESPDLLKNELEIVKKLQTAPRDQTLQKQAAANLIERDKFIAARINETLPDGATAILFLGLAHDIAAHLPADIELHKGILR